MANIHAVRLKFQRFGFLAVVVLLQINSVAIAATWQVCENCQYNSIQAAIDAAADGDTILVQSGSYVGINLTKGLVISGSRDGNFQNPDVKLHPTLIDGVVLSPFMRSASNLVVLEHLEISGSSQYGVFQASGTDLIVEDCFIHDNLAGGVLAHSYYSGIGGATTIRNSTFVANFRTDVPYETHSHVDVWEHSKVIITGNRFSKQRGTYDYAITVNQAKDVTITNNEIFDNRVGISLAAANSAALLEVAYNKFHSNTDPFNIRGFSPKIHHNYVYKNDRGITVNSVGDSPEVYNNTIVGNGHIGLKMIGGTATKGKFYGNIIGNNNGQGVFMSGNEMGYGRAPEPTEGRFSDNIFFSNWGHVYNSNHYFGSANDETGKGYGGLNGVPSNSNSLQWATRNYVLDPGLETNGVPRLLPKSFAIDMGYSGDGYSNEPLPNGALVNIGADGNSDGAMISPAAPTISNFALQQVDEKLMLTFDSNASVTAAWIKAEYFDGISYKEIPAGELSGDFYVVGFNDRGRIGLNSLDNSLVWNNFKDKFPDGSNSSVVVRLTLDHAGRTGQAVASNANQAEAQIPSIAFISPLFGVATHSSQPNISVRVNNETLSGLNVRFFIQKFDDSQSLELASNGNSGIFNAIWGANRLVNGDYFIRVKATDAGGNITISSMAIKVN